NSDLDESVTKSTSGSNDNSYAPKGSCKANGSRSMYKRIWITINCCAILYRSTGRNGRTKNCLYSPTKCYFECAAISKKRKTFCTCERRRSFLFDCSSEFQASSENIKK